MVRLTVEKPNQEADTVTFDAPAELTIGRSSECAYCLDFDPLVSRMHAVLLVDPPSIRIKDLNSTNGLVINGEVFGASSNQRLIQPLELRDGDEVMVGQTRFAVSVGDADLDLGPEFMRLKAEQEAADAAAAPARPAAPEPRCELRVEAFPGDFPGGADAMETLSGAAFGMGATKVVARGREVNETVADLAAVCPEIPGYRVDRFVAAGKTGNVYKARSAANGKNVILKVSPPGGPFSRKLVDDFRREMEEFRELSHRGIAELFAFGDMGQSTFFAASEFVNGENLASYLTRCPGSRIPNNIAFSLLRQMTDAICYLHNSGIVHRDIHPGGVMLFDDNGKLRAKFTDAGTPRFWIESGLGARSLMAGETAARLGFIAPEELVQQGEAKPSADVFSLGSVFYRMVTGRVPYEFSDDVSAARVVEEARIRPIEEFAQGLPETVVVIAERALAPEPEMRYESAIEMLEALENISM